MSDVHAGISTSLMPKFEPGSIEHRVDVALAVADGNRTVAAEVLEMKPGELLALLKGNPVLSKKWLVKKHKHLPKNPEKLSPIRGLVPSPLLTLTQEQATPEQTQAYQASLSTITDPVAAELGAKLYAFQIANSNAAMAQLGGGLVRASLSLLTMIDRLKDKPYPDEFAADGKTLMRSGVRLADEMILRAQHEYGRRTQEFVEMEIKRAKIKAIVNAHGPRGAGHGKPGFSPPRPQNVLVQSGGTAIFPTNGDATPK